jgi:surfeit locus 1 family protein
LPSATHRSGDRATQSTTGPPVPSGTTVTPIPGLTVVTFHNSHLVYAITWYTLALMTAIAIGMGMRRPRDPQTSRRTEQ